MKTLYRASPKGKATKAAYDVLYSASPKGKADRARRKAGQRSMLSTLKLELGCADCGYAEDPVALDFDHRLGAEKSFNVGQSMTRNLEEVLAEVEKCDVRCANCHRIATHNRRTA